MEVVPNHMTLDGPDAPWNEPLDYPDEPEDSRPTFEFIDGSRLIFQEFDAPIVELPKGKPWLIASCAQMVADKVEEEGWGNEETEGFIKNLFQYKNS